MNHNAKLTLAHMLCDEQGIQLKESHNEKAEVKLEYTGHGYRITMPALDATWDDNDPRSVWWWGTFTGLVDRLSPSTAKMEVEAVNIYNPNTLFGQVLTRVLATNATHMNMGDYSGKDDWVVQSMDQNAQLYEQVLKQHPVSKENKDEYSLAAVNLLDQLAKSLEYGTNLSECDDQELVNKVEEIATDYDLIDVYNKPKYNLQQNVRVARKILEHLDHDPDEEEQKAKDQVQVGSGEGEGEGDLSDSPHAQDSMYEQKHTMEDGGESKANQTIKYEEKDLYDNNTYVPFDMKVLRDMAEGNIQSSPWASDKLSRQIANVLKVRSQVRWQGGKRSGRLRNRSLARAATDQHYDTPFRKKEDNNVLDTCVLLMVDTSGSMGGTRYDLAMESAVKLEECLSSVHIPVSVVGFTQSGGNNILLHKEFNETPNTDKLYSNMKAARRRMGCNDDGASLDWCYSYISKQKNKRKIIIVLSDGQPAAGSAQGSAPAYLRHVVGKVEKEIDLYGIGIESNAVSRYYKHHKVLDDVHKLERTILDVIKEKVI